MFRLALAASAFVGTNANDLAPRQTPQRPEGFPEDLPEVEYDPNYKPAAAEFKASLSKEAVAAKDDPYMIYNHFQNWKFDWTCSC